MLCNDEQQEAKKLERTSAERLREECSERFSRINDHFSKAIERLDKHFSSFAARVKSINQYGQRKLPGKMIISMIIACT